MKQAHLTMKVFSLIVLNDLVDTIAQLFMKKGLVETGIHSVNLGNMVEFVSKNASSVFLWVGILIYALNFFIWIIVLYKVDLSIAMPVGSFSYIFIPISAILFLHEKVSPVRWIGIACIIMGIHCVSKSNKPVKKDVLTNG